MKKLFFIFLLLSLQATKGQGIRLSKMIDGKMFSVTPSTKVYDSTGSIVPFEKWFSMIEQYDLKPNPVKEGEEQTFRLVRYADDVILKRKEESEKRRKDIMANPIVVGNPINSYSIKDIHLQSYSKEAMLGKVVVLNYWFVDCAPCVKEIPELNELKQSFDSKKVVFMAVNPVDTKERVEDFLKGKPFDFIQVSKEQARGIKESTSISAFPSYIIIDPSGNITFFNSGYSTNTIQTLKKHIEVLLK